MPEAAEVKIISEHLSTLLLNKRVIEVKVSENYSKKIPKNLHYLTQNLPLKCHGIMTWGKLIICKFHNGLWMTSSLGMTGNWTREERKHNHVEFVLEAGYSVFYNDPRKFGTISFLGTQQLGEKLQNHGIDILREENTEEVLTKFKLHQRENICVALMSQQVLAGVGNYIKAEALFRSKISPLRTVKELSEIQLLSLYQNCRQIAEEAYQLKGNSFHSFTDSEGNKGSYLPKLQIYKQKIDPYGNQIIKIETPDSRTTYYSPTIQI